MADKAPCITDQLLEGFLRCKRKSSLLREETSTPLPEYAQLIAERDVEFQTTATETLVRHMQKEEIVIRLSTPDQLTRGHELILNAPIRTDRSYCRIDALQKVPGVSSLGEFHYRPVRFCRSERIERCQKVLLAFAGSVIGSVQGRVPEQGIIIHGPKYRLSRLRLDTYQEELSAILDQLWELLDGNTIPPPVLNSHCDVCQFQPRCRREAVEVDHLSLLKGMSEKEIYRHNSKGIFTVTQLSYTFRLKRRPKRAKLLPPSHSYALQALAKRQKQVFVHGVPDIPCAAVNVYFDIEGIPDRNLHYLIGMVVQHNGRSEQFSFWADHADEEEAIFRSFLDAIPMHQDVRLFHYGSYETAAMRRIKGKMPLVYQDRLGQIQKLSVNVLNVVYHHFYFPVLSNSLKEVAGVLGFKWTEAGSTGLQSIVWREEWEKTRDQELKGRLCVYNRDDCLALQHVTEFMRNAMSTVAEGSAGANAPLPIESTDSLKSSIKKRHEFGSIEFVVPEFDAVNRCAYFDYQREKVYVRTNRQLRTINRRHRQAKRRLKPNKTVEVIAKKCIYCRSRKISKRGEIKRQTIDLRFGKGSVKKWITQYRSWRYKCGRCKAEFVPEEVPHDTTKYGHGLASWCVYNHVICGQNMLRIRRALHEVFQLDLPHTAIWRFKKSIADLLQPHSAQVLKDLLSGSVLHVDETQVKLRGSKGYVWVFASMDRVYFEYRPSRVANFLQAFLQDFNGVVVSDFFTGYDSLPVPQQKCVIHLIRDMNDDLLGAPYDREFRSLAQRFASLFQSIIKTIDRHGLKQRYLQKHKNTGQALFDSITAECYSSHVAQKYQKRIKKYGDRLLTFLDYDGVPWNNNNAEHAIKCFARFRRFADGRFTERSLREFLVILSVFQTCEFQNIGVLDFLLKQRQSQKPEPADSTIRGFGSRPEEKAVLDRIIRFRRKSPTGRRMTYEAIADMLNSEGVPTRRGGRWWGTTVRKAIRHSRRR